MESNPFGGIQQDGVSGSFSYSVKPGFGDKPVNYVSFWDAARFTNWLTNGQGSGDTESGVYNLGGVTSPTNSTITRNAAAWNAGGVAVASENEWYKAAYYQPVGAGGDADSYWLYPTASNSITTADANYDSSVNTVTDVGIYSGDASYYGSFDQGGNVWEWNDAIPSSSTRGMRGGSFGNDMSFLQAGSRDEAHRLSEGFAFGFRVTSLAPIPEPSTYAAIFGCLALTIAIVRRKGRFTL
jgi:formylglycine-generating enzyme required for sulfatase activity